MPDVYDRVIQHMHGVNRVATHEASMLNQMMKKDVWPKALSKYETRLKRIKGRGRLATIQKQQNYKDLKKELKKDLTKGFNKARKNLGNSMIAVAHVEARFTVNVMGTEVAFTIPTPTAGQLRRSVLKEPFAGGRTLDERFTQMRDKAFGDIMAVTNQGLIQGRSPTAILRRVKGARGPIRRSEKATATNARTAVEHSAQQARSETVTELAGFQEEWTTVRDTDVCVACAALDGQRYEVGQGPQNPLHEECRCDRIPVPRNSKKRTDTYVRWLRKQPKDKQEEALGKTRARLWRGNKVKISSFTDSDSRPLPLQELAKREGIKV
jgi:hypothetical protein